MEDSDDRARRIAVLAAEGQNVSALLAQLRSDADPAGGWGLTAGFVADSLDTSLALAAVAPQATVGNDVLLPALSVLAGAQRDDGGWACADSPNDESEVFCSGQALLALTPYRGRISLTTQINGAVSFLRGQLHADGSFGPAGSDQVINTTVASLGLVAASGAGSEVAAVISFLRSRQQPDGSWEDDPYTTALALQALHALATPGAELPVAGPRQRHPPLRRRLPPGRQPVHRVEPGHLQQGAGVHHRLPGESFRIIHQCVSGDDFAPVDQRRAHVGDRPVSGQYAELLADRVADARAGDDRQPAQHGRIQLARRAGAQQRRAAVGLQGFRRLHHEPWPFHHGRGHGLAG